jgi:hypothetical protein
MSLYRWANGTAVVDSKQAVFKTDRSIIGSSSTPSRNTERTAFTSERRKTGALAAPIC